SNRLTGATPHRDTPASRGHNPRTTLRRALTASLADSEFVITNDFLRTSSVHIKMGTDRGGCRGTRVENPPLDPLAYNMVALLAGTRTSPNKKFPQMPHPSSRSEIAARDISDRRAIVAVLNALLSVICTGAATWWAAQRTGWRDEWKVLLSLLAATIVAISEVGLYIIWESRRRRRQPAKTKADRGRLPSQDSAGHADTHDAGMDTSSKLTQLGEGSSQSTSIDPHQTSARLALRQRVGTASESYTGHGG
ncbi:hypothetical protein BJV77DRAFT_1094131, partial [Russula vinacea]